MLTRYGCLLLAVIASQTAGVASEPSAIALLRGVEAARTQYTSLRAAVTLDDFAGERRMLQCLIELDGARRRAEVLPGEQSEGDVVIMDGGELYGYYRGEANDVCIYDFKRGMNSRAHFAFDPRILGLSHLMPASGTVNEYLGYEKAKNITVVGKERIGNLDVWRVRVTKTYGDSEFWIEEPSFRVHRRVTRSPKFRREVEINSEFDPNDKASPFPKRVRVKRVDAGKVSTREITVTSLELGQPIPAERFSLKSIGLPINTMINDYRIHRIVGYWNGKGVSKHPVKQPRRPSIHPPAGGRRRWAPIAAGVALLVLVVVFAVRRSRRAGGR